VFYVYSMLMRHLTLTLLQHHHIVYHPALSAHELWTVDALDYRNKEMHLRKRNLIYEKSMFYVGILYEYKKEILYNAVERRTKITSR